MTEPVLSRSTASAAPPLSCPSLVSRPIDFIRLRARLGSMACAAISLAGLFAGLVVFELLSVESSVPTQAVTTRLILEPTPRSGRPSLPGSRKAGGSAANAAVPPMPRPAPRRLEVVPVPPPMTDAELPAEFDPAGPRDPGAENGPGGPGDGEGSEGGEHGCEGCPPGGGDGGDGIGPGGDGPGFLREGMAGLEPPVVIPSTRVHPDYPEIARKARISGSVLLLIVIDAEGRVGSIEVVESPDPRFGFELAAIEAVKRWRYRPARLGGRPVSVQASVRIEFTLAR